MINLQQVTKHYGHNEVLKGIDLTITDGESVAFLGANGAGKTTLIEIIARIVEPSSGRVWFTNAQGEKVEKKIGVQFQDGYWPAGTKPLDLIKFYKGRSYLKTAEFRELIASFELEPLLKRDICAMSGGQRQRFNCFLSILNNPEILILDELVTGLDLKMQIKLIGFIKRWKETHNLNLIIVSHNPEEVEQLCDRIVVLSKGRIYEDLPTGQLIKKYGSVRAMMTKFYELEDFQ